MHTPQSSASIQALPALRKEADQKSAKILARTIYRDMKEYGIPHERILEVASELIGLVTAEIASNDD